MKTLNNNIYEVMTMKDICNKYFKENSVFIKWTFPTSRWGEVYTKNSTTNLKLIDKVVSDLRADGVICKKRIDKIQRGKKFYKILFKKK